MPVFKVDVIPGDDSDPTKLNFGWQVDLMSERLIQLQMIFEEAVYVSSNDEPDILKVTFIDKYMFVGKNGMPIEFADERRRSLQGSDEPQFLSIERVMPTQIQYGSSQA